MLRRIAFLAVVFSCSLFAAQTLADKQLSNTQAILHFKGVSNVSACTLQVSEKSDMSVLVYDVDPVLYPGSDALDRSGNVVDGTNVWFVVGTRTYETASDNKSYSRALAVATQHYWTLTCSASVVASGQFTTTTIPFGSTHGEALPVASPGVYAAPTIDWSNQAQELVDAQTGLKYKRMTGPGGGAAQTHGFVSAAGASWTNPNNAISDDSNYATISASQDPIYLDWDHINATLGTPAFDGISLDYITLTVKAKASSAADIECCLSVDQGGNCRSPWKTVSLTTSDATYTVGTTTPIDTLSANPPISKQEMAARYGNVTYDSATKIMRLNTVSSAGYSGRTDSFNINWRVGSNVTVYGAPFEIESITAGATPTVTTRTAHGFTTGDTVNIAGNLGGMTGANGNWTITVTGATTFTLTGATTAGVYGVKCDIGIGTDPHSTQPGAPPRVYTPCNIAQNPFRARLDNFTDTGWTSLNTNVYTLNWYNSQSDTFTIADAVATGAYTQTGPYASLYWLRGVVQKVGNYPIASVDSDKQITLTSGPASDILGTGSLDAIYVSQGIAHACIPTDLPHDLVAGLTVTISGATPSSFNGTKTIGSGTSGFGQRCFIIGSTAEADNGYAQTATFTTVSGGRVTGQDYEYHPSGVMIRKKTTGAETISLQYVAGNYALSSSVGWGAAGSGLTHRTAAAGWYLGTIADVQLWGFKADGTEAKYFGIARILNNDSLMCFAGGRIDPNDPLTWYCMSGLDDKLYKSTMVFDGTDANGATRLNHFIPLCSNENVPPCWGPWIELTPTGLSTMTRNYDTAYWDKWLPSGVDRCIVAWGGLNQTTNSIHVGLQCGLISQNGGSLLYVLDLGNQTPYGQPGSTMQVIARRSTWDAKGARWTGIHGGGLRAFPEKGYYTWAAHPLNDGMVASTSDWYGPYYTTMNAYLTTTLGSCAAFAGNQFLPSVIPAGAGCDTRTVTGEPCDDSIGWRNETTRYLRDTALMNSKCGRTGAHYLQDALPGDYFIANPADETYEVFRLIDKGVDGKTWTFYRGDYYGYYNVGVAKGAKDHFTDFKVFPFYNTSDYSLNIKAGVAAWDYMTDPAPTADHDALVIMRDFSDGHGWDGWLAEARSGVASPLCGAYCYGVRTGTIEKRWPRLGIDATASLSGSFAGQAGRAIPNFVDTHATMAQAADGADTSWWLDGRPQLAAQNGPAGSVSGQRYKWTIADQGTSLIKYKHWDLLAYAGDNPIVDVSGPASSLGTTSSDSYKMCYAIKANECVAGSAVGDFYINAPQASTSAAIYVCCGNDPSQKRDIGWAMAHGTRHYMTQTMIRDDAFGKFTRSLGRGLLRYRIFDTFYNLTETANGRVAAVRAMGLGGIRSDVLSFNIPPVQFDSVARNTFIPVRKEGSFTDATATHARAKFGYTPDYKCTNRADVCYAVSNHIDETTPFLFGAELAGTEGVTGGSRKAAFSPIRTRLGWLTSYTDVAGNVWAADPQWPASQYNTNATVLNTADPILYAAARISAGATPFSYTFSVIENRTYIVTLKFAEIEILGDFRKFNIDINGVRKATNFDIYAEAGGAYRAVDKNYTIVVPAGTSTITITLTGTTYNAMLNAIQIVEAPPGPGAVDYRLEIPAVPGKGVMWSAIEELDASNNVVATHVQPPTMVR